MGRCNQVDLNSDQEYLNQPSFSAFLKASNTSNTPPEYAGLTAISINVRSKSVTLIFFIVLPQHRLN